MAEKNPVDTIVGEHENVRHLVSTVGNTMDDLAALFRLETERFEWSQAPVGELTEKRKDLEKNVDRLWQDLRSHFTLEEKYMAQIFGPTLAKGLMADHEIISREFDRVRVEIAQASFEGQAQQQMLQTKDTLQKAIGKLTQMIEDHARDEEVLIRLVKKAASRP
jgi:hemerythrin